jgi:hypothetical protein
MFELVASSFGLFCGCNPGKTLPGGPSYSSRFVVIVSSYKATRRLRILGARWLRRKNWSKGEEFGG